MTSARTSFEDIIVGPELSIIEAVGVLNSAHKRIVLVVDDERQLLGVMTDSNVRHAVLEGIEFRNPVSRIMRTTPITAPAGATDNELLDLMERTHCYQVPVVDKRNRVVSLKLIEDLLSQVPTAPRIAVIMAGGLGMRLRPLTEHTPKPLVEVGNQPLLFTILDQLLSADFNLIYLTVNYRAQDIRNAVEAAPRYAECVRCIEEIDPLGTAGPLSLLPAPLKGPLVVMNGDLLTKVAIDEMMNFHKHENNAMTVALREEKYNVPYGVARLSGTRIVDMVEKPDFTHFVNAGVYVLEPEVVEKVPRDRRFDMTSLIDELIGSEARVGCFPVHEYWLDIGRPEQLEKADKDYSTVFRDADPSKEPSA